MKKTKKQKLKTYTIVNEHDGNDTFEIQAVNDSDAAHKALETLGWWVAKLKED